MVVTHTRRRHLPKLIFYVRRASTKKYRTGGLEGKEGARGFAARNAPSFPSRPPVLYFFERSEEDPFKVQNARRKASGSLFLSPLSFALGPGLIWRTIPGKSHFFADHFPPKFCQKNLQIWLKMSETFFAFLAKIVLIWPNMQICYESICFLSVFASGLILIPFNSRYIC